MKWIFQQLGHRCLLHDLARVHHRRAIRELRYNPKIMRDQQNR